MKEFTDLIKIIERLMGPGGCPWDQEQTLMSIRELLLEEACELIDAINQHDNQLIQEELGDVFFNLLFCCKLGEKEGRLKLSEVIQGISDKLIRRHPHVFENSKVSTSAAVIEQWEKIKKHEKANQSRKSALDGIPHALPALSRAQKVIKRLHKACFLMSDKPQKSISEERLGEKLLELVNLAYQSGIDAEMALRKALGPYEDKFRIWEQEQFSG